MAGEGRTVPATLVVVGALLIIHDIAWLFLLWAAAGAGAGLHPRFLTYVLLVALAAQAMSGVGISLRARWGVFLFALSTATVLFAVGWSVSAASEYQSLQADDAISVVLFVAAPIVVTFALISQRHLFSPR